MSNKIDGPGPGALPPAVPAAGSAGKRQDVAASPQTRAGSAEQSARVEVTDTALKLKRLEEKIRSLPAVDEARVQEIRDRLASGAFEIDGDSIADKLINFEKDFD